MTESDLQINHNTTLTNSVLLDDNIHKEKKVMTARCFVIVKNDTVDSQVSTIELA